MRVLYLSQYFPPEVGATQTRAYEMAQGLVRAGHSVTMIAEVPNHPAGVIPPEYRGKIYERSELDGIDALRVWVRTSPIKTFRSRMAFYLSYASMAVVAGLLFARGRFDVIYATSPPLFVGAAGLVLSYLRRTPLVLELRDLWVESAVALGELRSPRAIRWATRLEGSCYRRARRIVVTAREMVDYLVDRGLDRDKIAVVRNGSNVELFRPRPEAGRRIRESLDLSDRFLVLYAGLLGIAQGLEIVLEAAALLSERDPDVRFLLIGDGPVKAGLQEQARGLGLQNVSFLPAQPRHTIPDYLAAANVALVSLTRKRLIGALPSKMFDAMACQRSVLLCAEGEACDVLREADAGIVVPPGDPAALAEAILELKSDPERCARHGRNGREAVQSHYSRRILARELTELLEQEAGDVGDS
jgi:glycosyltransferase involved in cell wall biosynthesis